MDAYTHEKEQIDQIKAWWKENWIFIVSGVVIAIGGVSGWRSWEAYQLERAESASERYEELLVQVAAADSQKVDSVYAELKSEFGDTTQAVLAALKLADLRVTENDLQGAAAELRWAADNAGDRELGLLARLRLARVLLADGKYDQALAIAQDVRKPGKLQAAFDEIRGDVQYLQGNRDAARSAYEDALANAVEGVGDNGQLQAKLDNVAMPVDAVLGTDEEPVEGEE